MKARKKQINLTSIKRNALLHELLEHYYVINKKSILNLRYFFCMFLKIILIPFPLLLF